MNQSGRITTNVTWSGLGMLACGLLTVGLLSDAEARYRRPEISKVPVERLAANLEETLLEKPKSPEEKAAQTETLFNLARLHAMAYASKTDTTQAQTGGKGAWFGYEPKHIPFQLVETDDAAKTKAAMEQLEKAIARYEETLKLDADHLSAQLGLAWCLDQSGKKTEAIAAYRRVADNAWKVESKMESGPLGFHPVTAEAASYLVPLLDAEKDSEEIALLEKHAKQTKSIRRPITPIAIPLNADANLDELIDSSVHVAFDADGTDLAKRWSWITPEAGWLVHDPQGTGEITSALQMFGNVSFWLFWENGYHALSALDDNHDGKLTGKELASLAIWQDRNRNGISEPGEVKSLAAWDIVELSCKGIATPDQPNQAAFAADGVMFRDGSRRTSYDILLHPAR